MILTYTYVYYRTLVTGQSLFPTNLAIKPLAIKGNSLVFLHVGIATLWPKQAKTVTVQKQSAECYLRDTTMLIQKSNQNMLMGLYSYPNLNKKCNLKKLRHVRLCFLHTETLRHTLLCSLDVRTFSSEIGTHSYSKHVKTQ